MGAVVFRGTLFNNPGPAMRKACGKPLANLGAQIEATVRLNTPQVTSSYARSLETIVWQDNRGVSVRSTDTIKRKTWLERGTRNGVKLARGYRMWEKGKRKARQARDLGTFEEAVARALND